MPKTKVNDVNLYYEIHGKGQPIIFISGFIADHTKWDSVVNEFAKEYQVVVFDNRGTGQSDCPAYPYTIEMLASDVVGLCKNLAITSAHFVGNSMGGAIVQMLAYNHSTLVKTAVICNSFIKVNLKSKLMIEADSILRKANAPLEARIRRTLCDLFSVNFLNKPGMADFLFKLFADNPYPITDQGYFSQLHAAGTFDSQNWISKITTPSLVIYSDEDQLVDLDSSIALAEAIPNAKNFCFNKVGHLPDNEQPELFIKVVKDFIKNENTL
jgi:3-oxoadipate enol-lactonase